CMIVPLGLRKPFSISRNTAAEMPLCSAILRNEMLPSSRWRRMYSPTREDVGGRLDVDMRESNLRRWWRARLGWGREVEAGCQHPEAPSRPHLAYSRGEARTARSYAHARMRSTCSFIVLESGTTFDVAFSKSSSLTSRSSSRAAVNAETTHCSTSAPVHPLV